MAIGGAFLGGGVEVVPAGSCKLELEILTEEWKRLLEQLVGAVNDAFDTMLRRQG